MPLYEHTVIARPDLSSQQAQALSDDVRRAILTTEGGKLGKVEYWGLRNLAYRVKKHRKGHYHLNSTLPRRRSPSSSAPQRIHEDVLRYLTVRVERSRRAPRR